MMGLSFLLLMVSVVSYMRIRDIKMVFLIIAFLLFLVKGVLLLTDTTQQSLSLIVLDLIILISLYVTVAKR